MKVTQMYKNFLENEKAGGIVLILATIVSLVLANSSLGHTYIGFWEISIGSHTIEHYVNDGLMTIFFLLIGLELEREVYAGELSNFKKALLPIVAALGGMLVPAGIHMFFNVGTPFQSGSGIPMATDIAFAVGILSLLGNRVPLSLKVFLTALAVIDDLGAIFTIAIFYSKGIDLMNLGIAGAILGILFILNRRNVNVLWPYLLGGVGMWYFMLHSGVHATITGVILAFVIPFGKGDPDSISIKLEHFLSKPVAFIILPVFALANTCILIDNNWTEALLSSNSIGIFLGLVVGKPLGITLFCAIAVWTGICSIPKDLKWMQILAVACLGGIGFTMSIFITLLAFDDHAIISGSKITIMLSSLTAAMIGLIWLKLTLKEPISKEAQEEL
ncbi:Na+/H+ antiporter NhaA [Cytophaga aurantiaca]|uniref:Na+/H+ antiporter NhaA n=1 Tax=Cytophaga aurantiaca TaxID=29530 RepID=UPI000377E476|nr:Na+/H+ antiporter NhaA [Cytophaga aurantiaca]